MKTINNKQRLRIFVFSALLISIISISGFAAYAMQPVTIPTEVKEPLEILEYPTGFSLFPGETINFNFTIENFASVNYFQEFEFLVNDTNYQKYVSFSNYNYSIPPGINKLNAWMTIASNAPTANFEITINKKTDTQNPTPTPINIDSSLNPTLELLAGGARWVAQEGNKALYINGLDNWKAHSTTDGTDWQYGSIDTIRAYRSSVIIALEDSGFEVTTTGDIPEDLSEYDLVVIFAYYATEPQYEPQIRDYIYNGGNVVFIAASQSYLTGYSKHLGCNTNLEPIQEWFGASTFSNRGGPARVAFDNPLETSITTDVILIISEPSASSIKSLNNNTKTIAIYDTGEVFAFTHEYGTGRVYYQVAFTIL